MDASPGAAGVSTEATPLPLRVEQQPGQSVSSHQDPVLVQTTSSSAAVDCSDVPAAHTDDTSGGSSFTCRDNFVTELADTTHLLHELASVQLGEPLMARYLLDTSVLSRCMASCNGPTGGGRAAGSLGSSASSSMNRSSSHAPSPHQDGAAKQTTASPMSGNAPVNELDRSRGGSSGSSSRIIRAASTPVFRYKVVLLGRHQVGKTSLRRCLESEPFFFMRRLPDVRTTTGMEVTNKILTIDGRLVRLALTDCAGQESYHSHTFFLTQRTVFVLVWKMSAVAQDLRSSGIDVSEEEQLESWIAEVSSKFPGSKLVLVATHLDELRVQGQRTLDLILSRVEHRLNGFLDRIAARSAATATAAAAVADTDGISPAPPRCRIVGNFAVSCQTRQVVTTTLAQRHLADNRITSLARFLAELAREGCVEDVAYPNARVPRAELGFVVHMEALQQAGTRQAMSFRHVLGMLGIVGASDGGLYMSQTAVRQAAALPSTRLFMSMREFGQRACQAGVEPTVSAVLRVANLLHDWDIIYLLHRRSLSKNDFVILQPRWVNRIAAALFSFAHVSRTPLYLRSMIDKLGYTVSVAQSEDRMLMRKGYLRWPLARVLFQQPLGEFLQRLPDDTDVAMCLYLLQRMQMMYPVSVSCDDRTVIYDETPLNVMLATPAKAKEGLPSPFSSSSSLWVSPHARATRRDDETTGSSAGAAEAAAAAAESKSGELSNTVTRYYIPSLSPQNTPHALIRLAPVLFHRGVRLRMEFNLLPDEMWWRLQCRLHDLICLVTVYQPGGGVIAPMTNDDSGSANESLVELEEEAILFDGAFLHEADEEHNRWRDALWLGDGQCRVFIYREERTGVRVFTAEQSARGAEAVLQRLEHEVTELLPHYAGVQRCLLLPCPSAARMCAGWVDARVVASSVQVSCPMCGETFEAEQFVSAPVSASAHTGRSALATTAEAEGTTTNTSQPQQHEGRHARGEEELFPHYSEEIILATADLFRSCLGVKTARQLCRFMGIPYHGSGEERTTTGDEEAHAESVSDTDEQSSSSSVKNYPFLLDKVLKAILFNAWADRTNEHAQRHRMLDNSSSSVYF